MRYIARGEGLGWDSYAPPLGQSQNERPKPIGVLWFVFEKEFEVLPDVWGEVSCHQNHLAEYLPSRKEIPNMRANWPPFSAKWRSAISGHLPQELQRSWPIPLKFVRKCGQNRNLCTAPKKTPFGVLISTVAHDWHGSPSSVC